VADISSFDKPCVDDRHGNRDKIVGIRPTGSCFLRTDQVPKHVIIVVRALNICAVRGANSLIAELLTTLVLEEVTLVLAIPGKSTCIDTGLTGLFSFKFTLLA
jgi:hypothetical protein